MFNRTGRSPAAWWAIVMLLLIAKQGHGVVADEDDDETLELGAYDRFWRHHVTQRSLLHEGKDYFDDMENCLHRRISKEDWEAMDDTNVNRRGGKLFVDDAIGQTVGVVVEQAMMPVHIRAVQSLAACVREFFPHLYESRSMAVEMGRDESEGIGGNCPTHLAPLMSIFLPQVRAEMQATLETAYQSAGWTLITRKEKYEGYPRSYGIPDPQHVGIRASEHLTYKDFPTLAEHTDGFPTKFTMNFAFSDDYEGGEFYIMYGEDNEHIRYAKPNTGDALVFLGGRYLHGVNEIKSGNREMFSTEFWPYPDIPWGSNLWTSLPENMIEYVRRCNAEEELGLTGPCKAPYPNTTMLDIWEEEKKEEGSGNMFGEEYEKLREEEDFVDDDEPFRVHRYRPNKIQPTPLKPTRFLDSNGKEYSLSDFYPEEEEPSFLIPKNLEAGEMAPLRWRDTLAPVDGSEGETFAVSFPPELLQEFQSYVERSGMMDVARKILYEEEPLEDGDQRLYTLEDGMKWTAMVQGSWETDMVWLDPGDEECFESLLAMLKRGKFSTVLDKIGKTFDLNGLMIQGVGAIFLSEYEYSNNMHTDLLGSKGSFYNTIVPVYIPENESAKFYIGDWDGKKGSINLRPDSGVVLGGESFHGTGECNYREKKDFRLSFAVYLADIDDDNIDLVASDSTSLWPTSGDTDWFQAQKHRLWSKDGKTNLDQDQGRRPLHVQDKHKRCPEMEHLCETDLQGWRLRCPKTCKLYMEDEVYYAKLSNFNAETAKEA